MKQNFYTCWLNTFNIFKLMKEWFNKDRQGYKMVVTSSKQLRPLVVGWLAYSHASISGIPVRVHQGSWCKTLDLDSEDLQRIPETVGRLSSPVHILTSTGALRSLMAFLGFTYH